MDNKKAIENKRAIERNVVIKGTYIRIKSIFGDIPLDKALANIAKSKLAGTGKDNSSN